MRWTLLAALLCTALLAPPAAGQDARSKTREIKGPEGRVAVTVPTNWRDQEISGSMILRSMAPGSMGGHDLRIEREDGQSDIDASRDRYLEYDLGNAPDGAVQTLKEPFLGYRVDDAVRKRVLLRFFVADGADGLVVTVTSRFARYDHLYAKKVLAVVATLAVKGGGKDGTPGTSGPPRRHYDELGRISLALPGAWKPVSGDLGSALLLVALKGSRKGPRFSLTPAESNKSAIMLVRISTRIARQFASAVVERENNPPRLRVTNRIPGSVEYIFPLSDGKDGMLLTFTVRENSFPRYRELADNVARSVVFARAPWTAPAPPAGTPVEHKVAHIFADAALAEAGPRAATTISKALSGFGRNWGRIGLGDSKKAPPLIIEIVPAGDFRARASLFGEPPVSYDRQRRIVVATAQPKKKEEQIMWRGRLYAALAEAALHRDLTVAAPPWLRFGLCACMDAAGRTGKFAEDAHEGYVDRLAVKTSTNSQLGLPQVLGMTEKALLGDDLNMRVHAWGYVHLMLYGKSPLTAAYKKWVKKLVKTKRGDPPIFDLKRHADASKDLKKHVEKRWAPK